MPPYADFQINFILFLQGAGEWLKIPMQILTNLGEENFFMVVMPFLYWCVDPTLGIQTGVALLFSAGFNSVLKLAFHGPRPFWIDNRIHVMAVQTDFGIPSGHAQNATAVWGMLAAGIHRRLAWVIAILLIFLISLSRLYLGVHFITDILAGWIVGGLLLWLIIKLTPPVNAWLARNSLLVNLSISLAGSLAIILVAALISAGLASYQIPQAWLQNAALAYPDLATPIHPFDISGIVTACGVLFGLTAGLLLLPKFGGFTINGVWWKRVLCFLIGVVGVLVFWQGLDLAFPSGTDLIAFLFRYLRYGLVGIWVSCFAPVIFVRLGLAGPKSETRLAQANI